MDIVLLNAREPMPMFKLLVWSVIIVVILVILKEVKKKADSFDTSAGKTNSWRNAFRVLRIVYFLSLAYLMYLSIEWLIV